MRTFDTPYIADWYAVSLRWLTLLGMVISLAMGDLLFETPVWLLIGLVFWNVTMTVFAGLNARMTYHRHISVAIDSLIAAAFFWLQGGLYGPVLWAGVLPILIAAIYFELLGALIIAALFSVLEVASLWTGLISLAFLQISLVVVFITLGVGLLFGFISRQLIGHLRQMRETRIEAEQRRIRMENERWRALYELSSTLTGTLSYKRVLDSVLDLGYVALNPDPDAETDEKLISAVMLWSGQRAALPAPMSVPSWMPVKGC
jgi:hypothetical protein